jgi:hypothetical protein
MAHLVIFTSSQVGEGRGFGGDIVSTQIASALGRISGRCCRRRVAVVARLWRLGGGPTNVSYFATTSSLVTVRFARDSPLEGGGFEPTVPRQNSVVASQKMCGSKSDYSLLRGNFFLGIACAVALTARTARVKVGRFYQLRQAGVLFNL